MDIPRQATSRCGNYETRLSYNGDKGGHFSWARGHRVRRNLVIGQDFLGPRFDAAVFHALTGAQDDLVIERNWVLGPSLVSFARLDTASSTPPEDAGRYTTIKHNVRSPRGSSFDASRRHRGRDVDIPRRRARRRRGRDVDIPRRRARRRRGRDVDVWPRPARASGTAATV